MENNVKKRLVVSGLIFLFSFVPVVLAVSRTFNHVIYDIIGGTFLWSVTITLILLFIGMFSLNVFIQYALVNYLKINTTFGRSIWGATYFTLIVSLSAFLSDLPGVNVLGSYKYMVLPVYLLVGLIVIRYLYGIKFWQALIVIINHIFFAGAIIFLSYKFIFYIL